MTRVFAKAVRNRFLEAFDLNGAELGVGDDLNQKAGGVRKKVREAKDLDDVAGRKLVADVSRGDEEVPVLKRSLFSTRYEESTTLKMWPTNTTENSIYHING